MNNFDAHDQPESTPMPHLPTQRLPLPILAVIGILMLGCGESPAGPDADVNPALADEANGAGIATGTSQDLPQGAAPFTGPGGLAMDATGEEFIQQLALRDGTVLRTSGIAIYAVPGPTALNAPLDRVGIAAALTGSLESVRTGSYTLGPPPTINFIDVIPYNGAYIRRNGSRTAIFAHEGTFTISSTEYFNDRYTCEARGTAIVFDHCEYQLGVITGSVEFTVTLDDGSDIVQERTTFSLPIRRRTIIAHLP